MGHLPIVRVLPRQQRDEMDRDDGAEAQSIYSLVYGSLEDDSTTRKKANEENAKHEPKFTAAPPASASPYCNVDADALATLPSLGRSDKDIRSAWGSSSQYGSSYSSGLQSLYGNPYGDCYGAKLPSPPRPSLKNSANQAEGVSMSENSSPNRYGQLDSSKEDGNIHLSLSDSTQRVDGVKVQMIHPVSNTSCANIQCSVFAGLERRVSDNTGSFRRLAAEQESIII